MTQRDNPNTAPEEARQNVPDASVPVSCDVSSDSSLERRRQLLKIGLVAAPVAMTLLSRTAWANFNFQCKTPSGFLSGNVSQHGTPQYCSGLTPGYWKNSLDHWPIPYYPTTVSGVGGHSATLFYGEFYEDSGGLFAGKTLLDVLQNSAGGGIYALANHIAAALLNAAAGFTPVLSVADVKEIWKEYAMTGYFSPSAGIQWDASEIVTYLGSTMS